MTDIKLNEDGDLQLIKRSNKDTDNNIVLESNRYKEEYDLLDEEDLVRVLLERALRTPKGHITIYDLTEGNIRLRDNLFGNDIYRELSEGLTLNFIARARGHIEEAIQIAGLKEIVSDVSIAVIDSHTIQIFISYINRSSSSITVNI